MGGEDTGASGLDELELDASGELSARGANRVLENAKIVGGIGGSNVQTSSSSPELEPPGTPPCSQSAVWF